jgi:Domain of unknown function (DUF4224)
MSAWLSDDELVEATHRRMFTAQARALERMGVPFVRRPDGSLLVSRQALEDVLQRGSAIVRRQPPANGLNWSKRA